MKNTNVCGDEFLAIGRREFVLGTAAALLLSARLASAQTSASSHDAEPKVVFHDDLAVPIPANPSFGKGKDRALVLGGGEYFAAWMLRFAYGLSAKGVPYEMPDIIVGTSAGAVVGSATAGGHLERLTKEFDFFRGEQDPDLPRSLGKHFSAWHSWTNVDRRPDLHGRWNESNQHPFRSGGWRETSLGGLAHRWNEWQRSALFEYSDRSCTRA